MKNLKNKKNIIIIVCGGVVVLLLLILLFGGKTTKCSMESKQKEYTINTDYKIKAKGSIVKTVTIKQVIESKNKTVLKNFKKQLEEQYKSNKSAYGGYTYKVSLKGNKVTTNVTIDYNKMDLDKFVKTNVAMKEYVNKDNKLTLDGAKKMYKSTGAKCK